jgi:hypothetical protein
MQQGTGKLEPQKVTASRLRAAQGLGAQVASRLGQCRHSSHGGAGNLQQDLRGRRQALAHRQQHPAGTYIEGSGKLQEFLAFIVAAADEDRDGQGKPGPFSPLAMSFVGAHATPIPHSTAAPWGPMPGENGVRHPRETPEPPVQPPKHPSMPSLSGVLFVFCSQSRENATGPAKLRKCKVLLHLGNSVAFFVDNTGTPEYDLDIRTHSLRIGCLFLPTQSLVLRNGHRAEEYVCV